MTIWAAWTVTPAVLVGAVVALQLLALGFRRLRRRGRSDHAPWSRAALFVAGVLLAVVALVSPLDAAGDTYLLSAHMIQHLLIGDVAPALVLLALRGPLLFFVVPSSFSRVVVGYPTLRHALSRVTRPLPAFALWATVIAAWHVPAAYDFALRHQTVHDLEHCSFLTVGLLAWLQLVDPARRGRLTPRGRALFATTMFGFSLALALALALTHPLYDFYAEQPLRLFGINPPADQQLAGLLMLVEQSVSLGFCLLFLRGSRPVALRRRATDREAQRQRRGTSETLTGVAYPLPIGRAE